MHDIVSNVKDTTVYPLDILYDITRNYTIQKADGDVGQKVNRISNSGKRANHSTLFYFTVGEGYPKDSKEKR